MRLPSAFLQRHASKFVFAAILALAAGLRLSQVDIAHFQIDQARVAQLAWDLARDGVHPSHFFALSAGYSNFPVSIYIYAPAFLLHTHIHALLIWNIALNLTALALCLVFRLSLLRLANGRHREL